VVANALMNAKTSAGAGADAEMIAIAAVKNKSIEKLPFWWFFLNINDIILYGKNYKKHNLGKNYQ